MLADVLGNFQKLFPTTPCGCFLVTFVLTLLSLKETVCSRVLRDLVRPLHGHVCWLTGRRYVCVVIDWLLLSRGALGTRMT